MSEGGHEVAGLRWFARGFVVTVVVGLALTFLPTTSRAAGTYTATANARLVGVDFTAVPAIAFDQLVDAGVSAAQAQIDSLGTTRAFASSPYPSDTVVLLPGLVAGITGGQTSALIPPYPLIAATNETTPVDHRELGTLVLDAQSTAGNSRGTVTDGATRAVARTTADDARVIAHAETTISSLQLTPVLSLDGVRTTADATRAADGDIDLSSSFEVAAISVLGQRIALTPSTLSLLGSDVPLGLDLSSVLGQLLIALADQGTTLEFIPAVQTDDGITAAGLRINTIFAAPPEIASGLKEVRAGVTLGLASVSVSNRTIGGLGGPVGDLATATDGGLSLDPTLGGEVPAFGAPLASGGVAPTPAGPGRVSTTRPLDVDISLSGFYPVLVLAAAVGVGLINLIRHLGVRSP